MALFFLDFGSFISTALPEIYFLELSDKDVDESFRYHYFLSVTSLYSPLISPSAPPCYPYP
jgi:hypothetical protein